jgi:hypothetical protein
MVTGTCQILPEDAEVPSGLKRPLFHIDPNQAFRVITHPWKEQDQRYSVQRTSYENQPNIGGTSKGERRVVHELHRIALH